jgi:hypothetical protein
LTATFPASLHTCTVQDTSDYRIAETYVFYTTTTEQYHRVFLKVVTHTRDVCCDLYTIGETHTSNLADS